MVGKWNVEKDISVRSVLNLHQNKQTVISGMVMVILMIILIVLNVI